MGKLIITKKQDRLLILLFEGKKPSLMESAPLLSEESFLGNIYLAKVKDLVPGMNGAFLSIARNQSVDRSLSEGKELLVANRTQKKAEELKPGDEVVIQIAGEPQKTKLPTATSKLILTGSYCVCSYFGHGISYSRKLSPAEKEKLDGMIQNASIEGRRDFQFTIRTNAGSLKDPALLIKEMKTFVDIFQSIKDTYQHRTCYTCFYQKETPLLSSIYNISVGDYDEIVTDEKEVCELLSGALPDQKIRFYEDDLLSLSKLYSIDTHLKEALGKKVWLDCGGYLVIEPTEAMVVIDVNSGKTESKGKKGQGFYLKINLEAAKEVARQLRIRNYSGMIMVDFINMESEEENRKLLTYLDECLKKDKIPTRLVDMTKLGVVEITRKKVSKPLKDFFM